MIDVQFNLVVSPRTIATWAGSISDWPTVPSEVSQSPLNGSRHPEVKAASDAKHLGLIPRIQLGNRSSPAHVAFSLSNPQCAGWDMYGGRAAVPGTTGLEPAMRAVSTRPLYGNTLHRWCGARQTASGANASGLLLGCLSKSLGQTTSLRPDCGPPRWFR